MNFLPTCFQLPGARAWAFVITLLLVSPTGYVLPSESQAASRIKDMVEVEGVRTNQLVGYGLVVGLNGTGDTLSNSPFTQRSLEAMLDRLGVNISGASLRTRNIAAVMVTAELPPFTAQGGRIDVSVASLGDATDLTGGTLLVTPILGADGNVYVVAQGSLAVGGFTATGNTSSVTQNVPTTARIANGGLVEREIPFVFNNQPTVRLGLRNPDFTTARRIAETINVFMNEEVAHMRDPATVELRLTGRDDTTYVSLLTDIEQLSVEPDQPARVVIDERTGVIVMGQHVRISEVAVAQGNLTISIKEGNQIVQPLPFSDGVTAQETTTDINVTPANGKITVISPSITLDRLVDGLNALGIGPRDIISILQAIKSAGALQADIVLM